MKKIALVSLASIATLAMGVSFAGGPAACAPAVHKSGLYVGLDLGYYTNNALKDLSYTSQDTSGFTYSALLGYQFNNNWAVQAGYIWNQDLDHSTTNPGGATQQTVVKGKFKSHHYYVALKGMLPLMDQFSGYMLVGPAHTNWKNETAGSATVKQSYWSPMGAVGVSYAMSSNVSFNLQYMFIAGPTASDKSGRSSQRVTIGANYSFAM